MTNCPSPFDTLQALQLPAVKTWDTHCNWTAYLESNTASLDSASYLRNECMSRSGSNESKQCPLLDQYCNSAEFVFASRPLLTVCSLYPNVTLTLPEIKTSATNITINDASRKYTRRQAFELSSIVSTGLLSYCALLPKCSRSGACSTATLSDIDGQLSGHGVVRCWDQICNSYVASVNPDFGGLGMILSYLIQISIAILSLAIIATPQFVKLSRSNELQAPVTQRQHSHSSDKTSHTKPQPKASSHLLNFHRFLSDFHTLQCYYSTTLQIATFIALYGPLSTSNSIKNPFDGAFLLLVSTNGIFPIAVTFYTLLLCNRLTLYDVLLTSLSAILGSCTGIELVGLLSKPYNRTQATKFADRGWPTATGGLAPEGICGRNYEINYPKKLKPERFFLAGAALCDALIVCVIVRWLVTSFPSPLSRIRCWWTRLRHIKLVGRFSFAEHTGRLMRAAVHVAAGSILVWCTAMELFFFYQMLVPQYDRIVNVEDWGFGQIVGIAVWAAVVVDYVRHELGLWWEDRT